MSPSASPSCPLCRGARTRSAGTAHGRAYHRCDDCGLTFVAPRHLPTAREERARYETHENDPGDVGYREFLDRLRAPLVLRLQPASDGLDYGSGPGPTLSRMLEEDGHRVALYDPFFAPDRSALERTYDFVACSETAEHFHDPAAEFERLDALLRPGGVLGIMTRLRDPATPLADWWYTRDPTHVCFYAESTFRWIAERFGWSLERPHPDVALFTKRGP